VAVTLAWIVDDELAQPALDVRDRVLSQGAIVPVIWRLEVANGLAMVRRRRRITEEAAARALADLSLMPIEPDPETWPRAWSGALALADAHRLTVYDAAYLELALRAGRPLATLDQELRGAAAARGVDLLP
jgi:predicted nucleic acid-binding protein